jgi:ABC-type glycerol-3-phosphate transport system substrate-binding protein
MKKMSTFQIAVLMIFGFSILIGVMVFALKPRTSDPGTDVDYGTVVVWGTLPASVVENVTRDMGVTMKVQYTQKSESSLLSDMKDVLSMGGDERLDAIILPPGEFINYKPWLYPLPETFITESSLRSTYVGQSDMYIGETGIYAIPLVIDPMVMYWNTDIFYSNAESLPPTLWDEFKTLAPKMTILGDDRIIVKRSTIPFGEYSNITNAKDIISMLIMQSGAPIISSEKGVLNVDVNSPVGDVSQPGVSALEFYMEFSNKDLPTYSWNRSLPSSKDMFATGDSAVYFGYASEFSEIEKRNPHLKFDVAMVPQKRTTSNKLTFGKMIGISMLNNSSNKLGAAKLIEMLTGGGATKDTTYVQRMSDGLNLPPAHRILLAKKPKGISPSMLLFYDAALISRSWPDPSPNETDRIFQTAVDSVLSSKLVVDQAISSLQSQLEQIVSIFEKKTNKK